jgi:gamma-glutamyltranspeptidase/glutathione hydrolase
MRDFHMPGRSAVWADNGMCATSHPLASMVAIDTLKRGGNAVDAAIAGAVLLGLCEPAMTGIGGDLFALVKPAGSETPVALNASGRAPAGFDAAALRAQGHSAIPQRSVHAVTVPGAIDGFDKLSARFGKLGLADSLAPSIAYMRDGVPVAARVASDWEAAPASLQGKGRDIYLKDGAPYRLGNRFALPQQADALERIAAQGRDAFYTGEIAQDMVAALQALGGTHTEADFASTEATWDAPISGSYRGMDIMEHPPNGQGATALLLAAILQKFDIASMDPFGAERAHIEAEATKLAYDARNRLIADIDHMPDPNALLHPGLADDLAGLIDLTRAMPTPPPAAGAFHKDTIYITVVDRDRMAVSLIYSIFNDFGSGIASDRFGILLHNRGAGFNLTPGHANEAGPGKRPMHTILPGMFAQNGKILAPFGVMGGQYQATGHARLVSNLVDFGMDVQEALDAPRCFADPSGEMRMEHGYRPEVCAALAAMGHNIVEPPTAIGGAQIIRIDPQSGMLEGASDPRKDGCALGY